MPALKVLQPQEVEVYYLLPALRREIAIALKQAGKAQKMIAVLLGITEAAVSHYFSGKRAADVSLPEGFVKLVHERAARIKDSHSANAQIQYLLRQANESRLLCKIHFGMDKNVPAGCAICFAQR